MGKLGSLTGDTDKLSALRKGLIKLGDGGFKQTLAIAAARAGGLVRGGFVSGTDPFGGAWQATVRGNPPLRGPTGALMAAAVKVRASATGLRVEIGLPYAAIHQHGGKAGRNRSVQIPARPYLPPTDLSRLPGAWRAMLEGSMGTILKLYLPA